MGGSSNDMGHCIDTPKWDNGWSKDCADYASPSNGWCCGDGACAGKEWSLGAAYNHPENNCCACRIVGPPLTDATTYSSGTSFAAPHASGVAAQLLAQVPTLTVTQVKEIILAAAEDNSLVLSPNAVTAMTPNRFLIGGAGIKLFINPSSPSSPFCLLTSLNDETGCTGTRWKKKCDPDHNKYDENKCAEKCEKKDRKTQCQKTCCGHA